MLVGDTRNRNGQGRGCHTLFSLPACWCSLGRRAGEADPPDACVPPRPSAPRSLPCSLTHNNATHRHLRHRPHPPCARPFSTHTRAPPSCSAPSHCQPWVERPHRGPSPLLPSRGSPPLRRRRTGGQPPSVTSAGPPPLSKVRGVRPRHLSLRPGRDAHAAASRRAGSHAATGSHPGLRAPAGSPTAGGYKVRGGAGLAAGSRGGGSAGQGTANGPHTSTHTRTGVLARRHRC